MYGAQAPTTKLASKSTFENDVEMYGAQAPNNAVCQIAMFENDVEMYGAQALLFKIKL